MSYIKTGQAKGRPPKKERMVYMSIQYMRKVRGMTQGELAEKAKISARAVKGLEQGEKNVNEAKLPTIIKLATALECSIYNIVTDAKLKKMIEKYENEWSDIKMKNYKIEYKVDNAEQYNGLVPHNDAKSDMIIENCQGTEEAVEFAIEYLVDNIPDGFDWERKETGEIIIINDDGEVVQSYYNFTAEEVE